MKSIPNRILLSFVLIFLLQSMNAFGEVPQPTDSPSRIVVDPIFSKNLNSYRKIAVYLPPGFQSDESYPVVYCTDGQLVINEYSSEMDSLIQEGKIPKIIMIWCILKCKKGSGKGI